MTWNGREEEAEKKKKKKQLLMRKMDDCRLAVSRDRGDGGKFAENPRDSKSDARNNPRIRAEGGIGRVSLSRRVDPRYSLPSIISFHERIFVRLDCDDCEEES